MINDVISCWQTRRRDIQITECLELHVHVCR